MKKHALNLLLVAFLAVLASCDNTSHCALKDSKSIEVLMYKRPDSVRPLKEYVLLRDSMGEKQQAESTWKTRVSYTEIEQDLLKTQG